MVLLPLLLYNYVITFTGGQHSTSLNNPRRASILPWSQYSATINSINSSEFWPKVPVRRRPQLAGVSEKMTVADMTIDNSIPVIISLPPNPFFRQHTAAYSNRMVKQPNDPGNRSIWSMNRFRRKNHTQQSYITTAVKHRLAPTIPNSGYYRIPVSQTGLRAHSRTREPATNPQTTRLHAVNTFEQSIPMASAAVRSIPNVHFSRLSPAPALSIPPTSNNIVNSILAQSQTGLAPPGPPPPFLGSSPNALSDSVASLLSSGDAVESLAKFARNLLSLPIPNQPDFLSSLSSAVAGSKASVVPGNAVIEASVEPPSNILNTQHVFAELARKDFPVQSASNGVLENETENFLKTLPEEQRSLLQAAIQTGELDARSLQSAIGNASSKKTATTKQNEEKLLEWIQQNRKKVPEETVSVSADKLPYYGKYCGSFVGQTAKSNRFNAAGAVWAVDNRRFIISKFQFNPGTLLTENVTFWAGPNERTGDNVADMTPSANGFYLRPQPISLTVFHKPDVKMIEAHVRTKLSARMRRSDLFTELYEADTIRTFRERIEANDSDNSSSVRLFVKGEITANNKMDKNGSTEIDASNPSNTTNDTEAEDGTALIVPDENNMEALGWYAGFQPLLLTLPDNKWVKTTNWFALRDHKRKSIVAYVLIPNGPGFKIPAVVQLRGLTPSGIHKVRSQYIKILDTKTIEVNEFFYRSNGLAAWFVVGKDILPNSNGHIVPIYNRVDNSFDCDSLRDYTNETIILRLPGFLDIKDVFWFSIFAMEQGLSLSHIYFPYNDIHLPPDLTDISTPKCVWKNN